MMLIQNAYAEAARFLRRGLRTDAERLAVASAVRVGPGGEHLSDELTLKHLRGDEFFSHELFDQTGDSTRWPSMLERAHQQTLAMLAGSLPSVPEDIQENLRRFFHEETGGN
jgi:trimethylamine:corrinoid methyltransferase-like protein